MRRVLAGTLLTGALVTTSLPAPALAVTFGGIGMAPGKAIASRSDGSLHYVATAGQTIADSLQVINTSTQIRSLRVTTTTARISSYNDFSCATTSDTTWLSVPTAIITVQPGASETIPLTVTIPQAAPKGEYNACVTATEITDGATTHASGVQITPRVALRAAVLIPGENDTRVKVQDLSVAQTLVQLRPRLAVETASLVSLSLEQHSELKNLMRRTIQERNQTNVLLPQAQATIELAAYPRSFWGGLYRVSIQLTSRPAIGSSRTTDKTHTVTIHRTIVVWPRPLAFVLYSCIGLFLALQAWLCLVAFRRRRS